MADDRTPGLPDPRLIVGDWTGEADTPEQRTALAYREADRRLRELHTSLATQRQMWAESDRECSAARAVAYQSVMGRVGRIIEDIERIASGS